MFMAAVEGSRQRDYVGIEDHAWGLVSRVLLDPQRLQAELDRLNDVHAEARAEHAGRLYTLDAEITKHERTLRRASEEKLNIDADDVRYTIYAEAEQRAADMLKRLRAERKAFAQQPVPGMSDDEAQELGASNAGDSGRHRARRRSRTPTLVQDSCDFAGACIGMPSTGCASGIAVASASNGTVCFHPTEYCTRRVHVVHVVAGQEDRRLVLAAGTRR